MAEVFRGRQLGVGGFEKTVAIKRILQHYASDESFKKMFQAEANLSAQLQHPNVVGIYSNGAVDGYLYLVMEFIDGKNVRQMLTRAEKNQTTLPIEICTYIVAETAKGLDYAHNFTAEESGQSLDLVHRDMSPQNIMISYDGAVKVVDFGIAKASSSGESTRAGVLKGKFGYMSPEQASGEKVDRRTDIFALGIILFEILTQRHLFATDDDMKTLNLVRAARVPKPSKLNSAIPAELDRIVLKALAREKSERYQKASELYEDLQRFMNQSFPKFIPTDFAKYMKDLFAQEMIEEKKRREKPGAEKVGADTGEAGTQVSYHSKVGSPSSSDASEKAKGWENFSGQAAAELASDPGLPPAPGHREASTRPSTYTNTYTNTGFSNTGVRRVPIPTPMMHEEEAPRSRHPVVYGIIALVLLGGAYAYMRGDLKDHVKKVVNTEVKVLEYITEDYMPYKAGDASKREPAAAPVPENKNLPGHLHMNVFPVSNEIIVNGKLLRGPDGKPQSSPLLNYDMAPGVYEFEIRAFEDQSKKTLTWKGSVEIPSDQNVYKDVVLK